MLKKAVWNKSFSIHYSCKIQCLYTLKLSFYNKKYQTWDQVDYSKFKCMGLMLSCTISHFDFSAGWALREAIDNQSRQDKHRRLLELDFYIFSTKCMKQPHHLTFRRYFTAICSSSLKHVLAYYFKWRKMKLNLDHQCGGIM